MKKVLLLFLFTATLFSCKKEKNCETWKFYTECIPKNSSVIGCGSSPIVTGPFCGDALNGVFPGAIITFQEDENVKHVHHFIEKVN